MSHVSWAQISREATALVDAATNVGATVRLVGSVGIRLHCPAASQAMETIDRPAKDLDLVVRSSDRKKLRSLLEQRGYVVDQNLLVAMEGQRFAFSHPETGLDVDVFVEKLEFCHTIELSHRWELHPTTIPIEDLLLQKLQVHELTHSDVIDAAVLLATHDVSSGGGSEQIDEGYVADLLARDWGFHRDATANLGHVRQAARHELGLSAEHVVRVDTAAGRLAAAIDDAKKSMAWRMRDRVGERVQWWDDVDEREDTY